MNDPIANIDKDGLADLPVLTVTATAIQRSMPSVTAQFINVATRLPVLATLAAHRAEVAGNAINGSLVAKSAGNGIGTGSGPEDWYLNNKTHQISWINGSGERAGYIHLGKTFRGYVNVGNKGFGFIGKDDGSAFLSGQLKTLAVSASIPCRYCLGGAGDYGPHQATNQELSLMLAIGTIPFGGEGFLADFGELSFSSLGWRSMFEAGGRGLVNAGAQYTGNRIADLRGGWVEPLKNINWLSVGMSTLDINFGSNAILSGNFNFSVKNGFQSTLTGTIGPLEGGGTMLGGTISGSIIYGLQNNPELGSSYLGNLGWDFLLTAGETGLGY